MDILLKDINAVIYEDGEFHVRACNVYIQKDRIAGIGELPPGFHAQKVIQGKGRLLIPGLINCHTHAYMTLFRNHADDLSFQEWLFENVMPLEDQLTPEDAYWGTMLACIEMIRTGTTCFLDMHMFPNQTINAVAEAGMRAVISRGLVGEGHIPRENDRRLLEAIGEIRDCRYPNASFMLAPHAVYTCDPSYLEDIAQAAGELDVGIHVHLSESLHEVEEAKGKYKLSPIEIAEKAGLFQRPTVAAHCVHLSQEDLDILKRRHVHVSTNPISNMKLGNGFAPIPAMLEQGIPVCIGTDGASSNNALNLFREMGAVSLIHKGNTGDARAVSASDALRFATVNGAEALSLGDQIGRIAPGCKADLVILDIDTPNFHPRTNLVSALSYSATGMEVDTVIINGRVVMENRELLTIDEESVYDHVSRISKRLNIYMS